IPVGPLPTEKVPRFVPSLARNSVTLAPYWLLTHIRPIKGNTDRALTNTEARALVGRKPLEQRHLQRVDRCSSSLRCCPRRIRRWGLRSSGNKVGRSDNDEQQTESKQCAIHFSYLPWVRFRKMLEELKYEDDNSGAH